MRSFAAVVILGITLFSACTPDYSTVACDLGRTFEIERVFMPEPGRCWVMIETVWTHALAPLWLEWPGKGGQETKFFADVPKGQKLWVQQKPGSATRAAVCRNDYEVHVHSVDEINNATTSAVE